MPPTLTPQAFVAKWRNVTLKERSAAQEHFIDLCHLVGHPTPAEADPTGASFSFEAGATKQRGGSGWADVWKRGHFAWEYKGPHADLAKAYQQLLQYREALENPPLLVVSDLDVIEIHTNFTNTVKQVYRLTLDDLLTLAGMERLRAVFVDPEALRAQQTTQQVTEDAAREFARLADLLRRWKEDPHRAAHFLIRLLFCLFAEDIGLLPRGLFSRLIQGTHMRPAAFVQQLGQLFAAMSTGGFFGAEEIAYFNGRLFDDATVLELDSDGLAILARASRLDWSSIEPSILGTLFERSLDPDKRAQLGAHYTSRDDILLIVEPVLMAPLRRRWAEIQQQARALATRRDAVTGGQRTRLDNELRALLTGFAHELSQVRVLDPACGSGNFLYVALKQLLDLEKAVITEAADLQLPTFFPSVGPEQLRGIEVNDYAHELAQVTVWIGYIQWLRDNGFGQPQEPILKPLDTIQHMDAVLAFDERGQPIEPPWPEADVIIGNPPFKGDKKMRTELGDQYVERLRSLYKGRVPGQADFVVYWFEHTRQLIELGKVQRAGLLATNSIRNGASRKVLDRIKQTGDIFMAWSDRAWVLDGAAVRVSLVGFDNGSEQSRQLDGQPTTTINSNLTGLLDVTKAQKLRENAGIVFLGPVKGGPFEIDTATAQRMLSSPLNLNGRPNSDVVRRFVDVKDIVGRPVEKWAINFGTLVNELDAALYEQPFEYIKRVVKPIRMNNRRPRRREKWWIYNEPAPNLTQAIQGLRRCIVTPEVSSYRLFTWIDTAVVPDHKLHIFAREDDYFFGVLHSRVHEVWSLALCSWLGVGNDPSYASSITFGTFPLPWPPSHEPAGDPRVEAIAAAVRALVEKRDRWLNPDGADEAELKQRTLTNLYNQRPTWLDLAHRQLDHAVLDAYGWPHDLPDDEILARLLALNLERAAAPAGPAQPAAAAASTDDERE